MAMLEINGRQVEVSDGFRSMSPEQQAAEVDEIADHLGIAAPKTPPGPWDAHVANRHQPQRPITAEGLARAGAAGAGKGVVGIAGLPGDFREFVNKDIGPFLEQNLGMDFGQPAPPIEGIPNVFQTTPELLAKLNNAIRPSPSLTQLVTGEQPKTFMEYEPQNTAERYADTTGQFVGGAMIGPGSVPLRVASGVTGGLASEAAGQAFEGTPYEGPARGVAGFLGVVTPHVAAGARGSNVPRQIARQQMDGLTQADLLQADALIQAARGQGVDLSWPEAIQQVTNSGTRLADLQRVVENSSAGGPVMRQFYADRPAQIDAAARAQFDQIAPQPMVPERLGPRVQQAAEGVIDDTRGQINQQTRPLYQAAEAQQIPANSPILQSPSYRQAVQHIRNNPVIAPEVAHLPDNSIGMIDAAQKIMRSRAQALEVPGEGLNPYEASLTRQSRRQVTGQARNQSPEYTQAVTEQAQLRDRYLNPLEQGPTGKLAGTTDVGNQTRALFPNKPQAQSEAGVSRAMRGIGRTDPQAAENVVRQHLETTFNEATQNIQPGQNQFGGAKFSAVVVGNPQQRRNLIAALRELPNGGVLWRGFNRFLDVMEATGKRPAPNSMTEFNAQFRRELEQGGKAGELAALAGSPQKAMAYIGDKYKQFRLGRGTEQLARLFTQGNLRDFQRILRTGPQTPRMLGIIVRLLAQTEAGLDNASPAAEPIH